MVQTGQMGYAVSVVVTLSKPPSETLMKELDHHFGEVDVVVADGLEVVPQGSKITEITATSD